ncbi:hypothetical protein GAY31_19240 [Azospirillum brasilense]|nr:hypothetical protein [Azospirillum brasilense]
MTAEFSVLRDRVFADPINAEPADIRRLLELNDQQAIRQQAAQVAEKRRQEELDAQAHGVSRILRALDRSKVGQR